MDPARISAAHRLSVKIVFQFALIFVLFAAVLFSSTAWSIHQRRGLTVPPEARRVLTALERAALAAIRRRALRLPLVAAGCLGLLIITQQLLLPNAVFSAFGVIGASTAFTFGVLSSLGLALLCGHHAKKHAFLGIASASFSVERCLTVTVSGVALLTIGAEVFGVLAAACVHGTLWWMAHGTINPTTMVGDPTHLAVRISPYFGVGATVGSLALQQTGIACVGADKLAGASAFEVRTSLPARDPRNPSVLIDAIGCQLGSIVPRILDAFIGGTLVLAVSLQLASLTPSLGWPHGTESLAMIPLLVRGFGLLSALVALLTLRTTEHEDQRSAFYRGQVVAHVVLASALAGIIVWLVGTLTAKVAVAAIVGLLLSPALGRLRAFVLTRPRPVRTATVDTIGYGLLAAIDAAAAALGAMLWPLLAYACVAGLYSIWFQRVLGSDLQQIVALLLGLAVPSSLTAWNQVASISRDFTTIGTLSASVGRVPLSDEVCLRIRKTTEAFERFGISTDPVLSDGGALLCCLAAMVCQTSHLGTPAASPSVLTLLTLSLWVLIPGVLAVIESFRASARAARTQLNEIDRQLRGMRRDGRQIMVPEDFVPSYRSCVELLARDSAHGGLFFAVAAVTFPALTTHLGRIPENIAGSTSLSLASYAAIAAAAGLFAMHVGHAASSANLLAPRGNVAPRLTASPPVAHVSESLRMIEFLGHSLGVSVPLLTKAVALVTLAFSASLT